MPWVGLPTRWPVAGGEWFERELPMSRAAPRDRHEPLSGAAPDVRGAVRHGVRPIYRERVAPQPTRCGLSRPNPNRRVRPRMCRQEPWASQPGASPLGRHQPTLATQARQLPVNPLAVMPTNRPAPSRWRQRTSSLPGAEVELPTEQQVATGRPMPVEEATMVRLRDRGRLYVLCPAQCQTGLQQAVPKDQVQQATETEIVRYS